jgi:hypothetical protein
MGFRAMPNFRLRCRCHARSSATNARADERAPYASDEISGRVHVPLSGVGVFFVALV